MTLNTTHMRGKGGYSRRLTLKFRRCDRGRLLHMCAKFRGTTTFSCRENPDWGRFFDFMTIDFSSNFHLSFWEFKFWFSTSMFSIEFLFLLKTGANIANPVFLPKNTFVEDGCQFHYWSFEFSIFRFQQR